MMGCQKSNSIPQIISFILNVKCLKTGMTESANVKCPKQKYDYINSWFTWTSNILLTLRIRLFVYIFGQWITIHSNLITCLFFFHMVYQLKHKKAPLAFHWNLHCKMQGTHNRKHLAIPSLQVQFLASALQPSCHHVPWAWVTPSE